MAIKPIPTFENDAVVALQSAESFFLVAIERSPEGEKIALTYSRISPSPGASATLIGEVFKGLTRAALEGDED